MPARPRYEFKYVVPVRTARAFQECLGDAMVPDPHAKDGGYFINSIYYDTPEFDAYFEKIDGADDRYKVRLRFYGEVEEGTDLGGVAAFLEVKHRHDNLIHKERLRVPGDILPAAGDGRINLLDLWDRIPEKARADAETIHELVTRRPLHPVCIVSYYREPLVSRLDPTLRVTVDTSLRVQPPGAWNRASLLNGNLFLPPEMCVVEVKFHWAMPVWLVDICRESGLNLRRYSKYCAAIEQRFPQVGVRRVSIGPG